MAQTAREHHFVPRSYLAGFTDNGKKRGKLYGFDMQTGKFFQAEPENVARERDFNRFEFGEQPPDALETAYGQFEGKVALAIRNICKTNDLTQNEDYHYLLNLIALLAIRNPALRRSMEQAQQSLTKMIGRLLVSDKQLYKYHLQSAFRDGFISRNDVPFEQMKRFVEADNYVVEISRESLISTEVNVFDRVLRKVSERYWCLLVAAPNTPDFITCDHPISLVYKQTVFPLDTRHAILGDRDKPTPSSIIMDKAGIAEINSRMLKIADRQIYSRNLNACFLDEKGEVTEIYLPCLGEYLS